MLIKKFIPLRAGLIFVVLDLLFWAWFVAQCLMSENTNELFAEGLFLAIIVHMPFSFLIATPVSYILPIENNSILPQYIFIFIVGIIQYYLIGYIIGLIIKAIYKIKQKNN